MTNTVWICQVILLASALRALAQQPEAPAVAVELNARAQDVKRAPLAFGGSANSQFALGAEGYIMKLDPKRWNEFKAIEKDLYHAVGGRDEKLSNTPEHVQLLLNEDLTISTFFLVRSQPEQQNKYGERVKKINKRLLVEWQEAQKPLGVTQ